MKLFEDWSVVYEFPAVTYDKSGEKLGYPIAAFRNRAQARQYVEAQEKVYTDFVYEIHDHIDLHAEERETS